MKKVRNKKIDGRFYVKRIYQVEIIFILCSIFFTIGICENIIILVALATILLLGFFILLVIDLNEQIDEEFEEFINKSNKR